jgi:hypothetical protein
MMGLTVSFETSSVNSLRAWCRNPQNQETVPTHVTVKAYNQNTQLFKVKKVNKLNGEVRPRTGHEAQRGSRAIALLVL